MIKTNPIAISQALLDQFRTFIAEEIGIYFPKGGQELEKKLVPALIELGFEDPSSGLESLLQTHLSQPQIEVLARHLTVGETYFFRDPRTFAVLEKNVLPSIISAHHNDKRLRIWCGAAASGEEPYSIAILLHQLLPDIREWDIQIYASDISGACLKKAREGVYKKWSFRATPSRIKSHYFSKTSDDAYAVLPEVKKMVKFFYLNLAENSYPDFAQGLSELDLVICNNVLIYFGSKHIATTIKKLTSTLATGGWLLVTAIEVPYVQDTRLKSYSFENITFFRKVSLKEQNAPKIQPETTTQQPAQPIKVVLPDFIKPAQPVLEFTFQAPPQVIEKSKALPAAQKRAHVKVSTYEECVELCKKKYYNEAIAKLEQHLKPHRKHKESLKPFIKEIFMLARLYANQGQIDLAKQWCEHALEADKLNPLLYCFYATILQEKGLLDDAANALQRALYIDPNLIVAHFSLSLLTLRQGKKRELKRHFRNALELLKKVPPETIVEGTEDLTAARMIEIITSLSESK